MTRLEDLSPEQQEVISTWGKGMAVLAGAGSGKTTTLVIKCEELMKLNPEARFAAVSFTERSASDLKEKLSQRLTIAGSGSVLSGHWVMTIHGLCGAIIREFPREAGFDGEESILAEGDAQLLWERAIEAIWFDDITPELQAALETILERESRDALNDLLRRMKDLELFGVVERLEQSEDVASRALALLGRFTLERYERQKRRRGVVDFSDLERGADRALRSPEIQAVFRKRFDLVMVDEFQDTNPVQASILWRFARADASNLCVVGDPKQSIYRFRDADVSVFEDLCSKLPVQLSLTWNFRSRPGIIEYCNDVCAGPFAASGMRYDSLVPKREPTEAFDPVLRLNVTQPSDLANWIRAEMARGVPIGDMALLLRKIRGNEKWLKALTQAGVPIAIGSGGLFWEDPRVRELTAFLKWWDNPGNSLSGAVFLRAPWVSVPDEVLDQWNQEDPTWVAPFFKSEHPLRYALEPYRGRPVRPGELLMALLLNPEMEDELGTPLLGLWHRAENLSARGLDFHAVAAELATSMEESRRERDVPPPRNEGQLIVLTLHGSKGLEFPHVIVLDLAGKSRSANAPLLYWDRERGAFLAPRDEDGERTKKDPVELEWREVEKRKELAESKRLFYVAVTRARERLILVCPPNQDIQEPEKCWKEDNWRGWVECAQTSLPTMEGAHVEKAGSPINSSEASRRGIFSRLEPRRDPPVLKRPRHSVTEWNLLARCPRAYEWTYIRPVAVVADVKESLGISSKITAPQDALTQRELGTRVHACLEKGNFEGLKTLEEEAGAARFVAEPVIDWATRSPLMAPAHAESGRDVWTELTFEIPVLGEVIVGSIDRLVMETRDGVPHYTVVDFKVTEKAKSLEELLEGYQRQLELYTWAVGELEPQAKGRTDAMLVNISAKTIQTVPVPTVSFEAIADFGAPIAELAGKIVAGMVGEPMPGPLCRMCQFRSKCPEARVEAAD